MVNIYRQNCISSPLAYADLVNANFTLLFVRLINNSLREYLYPAALVDLRWELCATVYGIVVSEIIIETTIITIYNNNDILRYIRYTQNWSNKFLVRVDY